MIDDEAYEDYESVLTGERRPKWLKSDRQPKMNKWAVRAGLSDRMGSADGTELRLSPGLNATGEEMAYLVEQLGIFCDAKVITSVLRRVKGGKEANVYCCAAHPATGRELIAAKVYRPRQFRNLKNDSQYRQGRAVLTVNGQPADPKDWRLQKAIAQKSNKGLLATQTSWVAYEYQTMQRLYRAGADVPEPLRNSEHAILMDYIGEVGLAAPTLHLIALPLEEARSLFERLMHNIELMLSQNVIHGDLSAYNVLYWEGEIKIIDLPQVVDPQANPDARAIFNRDVERLCQYFARFGVHADPRALAREMWQRCASPRPSNGAAHGSAST